MNTQRFGHAKKWYRKEFVQRRQRSREVGKPAEKKMVGNVSEYLWEKCSERKKKSMVSCLLTRISSFFFFFLAFIIIQMLTGYKNIQQGIFLSFHRKIVVGKKKWCRSGFPLLLSSVSNFEFFFFFCTPYKQEWA